MTVSELAIKIGAYRECLNLLGNGDGSGMERADIVARLEWLIGVATVQRRHLERQASPKKSTGKRKPLNRNGKTYPAGVLPTQAKSV